MSSKLCPQFCNSNLSSDVLLTKEKYRKYINYLEVDPILDFQLGYVKYHSTPDEYMSEHLHSTSTEIVYIIHGNQTLAIDGIDYRISGGDILLSPPKLPHGGDNTGEERGDFFYLNINPATLPEILPQLGEEERRILSRMMLTAPIKAHCADSKRMHQLLDTLLQLYDDGCTFKSVRIRNVLCELLLLTADSVNEDRADESFSPFMQEVYLYIEDHLTENITVDALAAQFGYSKTAFRNKFKVYAHRTVHEYILHRKIEAAKALLVDGETDPKQVWSILSFSTPSYFQQVFKRHTGMSVTQYLESVQ